MIHGYIRNIVTKGGVTKMKVLDLNALQSINGGQCAPDGQDSFWCDVGQVARKGWDKVTG